MKKVLASFTLPVDLVEDVSKAGELYRRLDIKISNKTTERAFISDASVELLEMKIASSQKS